MPDTLSELQITRGDDNFIEIVVERQDINGVYQPVPLAGISLWFTGKAGWEDLDAAALFELTIGAGITVTDSNNGIAVAHILAALTRPLHGVGRYVYDVQMLEPGFAEIQTLDRGRLTVVRDVTFATS